MLHILWINEVSRLTVTIFDVFSTVESEQQFNSITTTIVSQEDHYNGVSWEWMQAEVFGACFDLLPCLKPWHGGKLTMTSCNLTIKDSITERHGLKSFMTDGPMLNLTYNQNSSSSWLKTYSTDANMIAWRNTENQQNHSTHFRMTFHACCRYLRNSGRPFEAN